jgi:hypothetical protein
MAAEMNGEWSMYLKNFGIGTQGSPLKEPLSSIYNVLQHLSFRDECGSAITPLRTPKQN